MSNYQLLLPKMGESVAEATIIKWLKNPGDYIEVDEAVLEIATDKVDSEVPSPVAGKLTAQLYVVDEVVQVGSPIALIQTEDTKTATQGAVAPQPPAPMPVPQPAAVPVKAESAPAPITQPIPQQPAQPAVQAAQIPGTDQLEQANKNTATKPAPQPVQSNRFYSPLVKNIAAQEGISIAELDHVPGTGAEGRLTKDDLLNYLQNHNTKPQQAAPPAQPMVAPQPEPVAAPPAPEAEPEPEPVATPIAIPAPAVTLAPPTPVTPLQATPPPVAPKPAPLQQQPPAPVPIPQSAPQAPVQPAYAQPPVQPVYQQQPAYMPPPGYPQQPPYVVYQQAPPMYVPPGYPQQAAPVYYAAPPGYPQQQPQPVQQPQAYAPAAEQVKSTNNGVSVGGDDEIIEMDRMRRLIADHMVNSKRVAPHVTSFIEADVTNLVMWRERAKKAFELREGGKFTFTPIFIEAVANAIKALPMINVSVKGTQIIKHKSINIGMATALPTGNLIVPVIKKADELSLTGLAKAVNDLADRARRNKLQPDEVKDGTFTITNVGTFGNVMGTPIINQPQVAILALGAIKKKPAVVETPSGDVITIRHMMFLSLSYDHRVVDGSLGGSFIKRVADYLENWDMNREA